MLDGKVVVVSGGAGRLGAAISEAILVNGGVAIIADADVVAAAKVVGRLSADFGGAKIFAFPLNVTSPDSNKTVIASVLAQFGRIDGLVNSAYPRNAQYGRKLEQVTYEDFCENTSMHLGGYFLSCKEFALHFKSAGGGSIVNISSVYGVVAPRFEVYDGTSMTMPIEYAAIKAGLIHLTKYFAKYFKGAGIRFNLISPGGILAGQPESFVERYKTFCCDKGMLDPHDVSGAVVFLLSENARYVNGQNIIVDDGFSL